MGITDIEYNIRNLVSGDLHSLLDMYGSFQPKNYILGLPPISEVVRVKWINNLLNEKLNVIAEYNGRLIGHSSIIDVPDSDFCEFLVFVHQDFRNRGIGTKLTMDICQRALLIGKKRVWLMVESANMWAIRLYYKIGFRISKVHGEVYEMDLDIETPWQYMSK
jgi:GNAT superfamily N-acetyltransferase